MTGVDSKLAAFEKTAPGSRSLSELNGAFQAFVRGFGFTAYAFGFVPDGNGPDEPFLLINWPRSWLELYAREGFASDDAVVATAAIAVEPFTWTELQRRQPGASMRIFTAARTFGWTDGLLVPVRLADGPGPPRLGVASLAAATLEGFSFDDRMHVVAAADLAFRRAVELSEQREVRPLSERERSAIGLVAAGRKDSEIAIALNVSVATAHFHVEQAKKKLGATTRAQAAAIAVTQGLISSV